MPSNLVLLTAAHAAVAAKRRARRDQPRELVFDDDARREFLTGFHKRKLAKAEAARAKAREREKQDRLEARRDQRRMLREQAAANASQVEKAYGATIDPEDGDDDDDDDEAEWNGISQQDAEYEDEETLATVTVVEDFDPDTIIYGPPKAGVPAPIASSSPHPPSRTADSSSKHPSKPKVRERKVRYETKDARRREQTKQRRRRTEKAERAGGKAARKPSGPAGKKHGGSGRR